MSRFRRFWVEESRHLEAFSESMCWDASIIARVALLTRVDPQSRNPHTNTRVLPAVKATLFDSAGSLRRSFL